LLLILISTFVILAVIYTVLMLLRLILFRKRKGPSRSWYRRALGNLAVALPLTLLLLPAALGFAGSRLVHTRRDEAAYEGPRFAADGRWLVQTRQTLASEAARGKSRCAVELESADGLKLRAFLVPARQPPIARVVMVHGLFRGALELEPVARMFHELDADVLMLELRNHGGSARAPATYGLAESQDVLAAVRFLEGRPSSMPSRTSGPASTASATSTSSPSSRPSPLVLFGVSLGTAAVALAAPKVKDLRGLVLDAPMTDLRGAADRVLTLGVGIPETLASVVLWCIEAWSGFSMDEIQLDRELSKLPAGIHVLVIGAGLDRRCPPAVVRRVFASLKAPPSHKQLWIAAQARHGRVWDHDPVGYRRRLGDLLAQIRGNAENR